MRRAAPGPQVSTGRLRVDAARAIAKLREYQLVDRAAWVLEGIRAAVAAGATRIELRGDANDIWLGWHGTPWEGEVLPRLFDELVSPEPAAERQHVRLLAAAVNSALGMNPAYVDVYSISARGSAQRVRYTPDVLAEPETELGEARLRHVAVEAAEPPTEIPTGMLVHLRRRAGLGVLSYWLGEPPELPLARAACADIVVPLVVDEDRVLQRDARHDLVRVPLGEGLDGFVAITDALSRPGEVFEVAERGVVLARYGLDVLGYTTQVPVPVRVFLDAERLPTNASRSQVRRDVHPIAAGERRARQVIATAIAELAKLTAAPSSELALRARRAAFSLLASSIGGHPVGWRHPAPVVAPLAALELARNALGEPRPVNHAWTSDIHYERKPLDADLEPWLGEMLWAPPDDPVRLLLAGIPIDASGARRHVRAARVQRRAHKKFLAHTKREIRVQTSTYPRARVSLGVAVERSCVPQSLFADISGEICVYGEGEDGAVVLCVDGRELERVEWSSPIAFDAVVDSSRLSPTERYRGVQRDEAYAAVTKAVRAGVIRAVETVILDSPHLIDSEMVLARRAIAQAKELGLELTGPLVEVGAWRKVTGERASFADLRASRYIGVIGEDERLVPPHNRVVVHAAGGDREELRQLFGNRIVSYYRAVTAKGWELPRIADHLPKWAGAASMILRGDELSGAIALSGRSALYWYHRGIPLGETPYQHALIPCSIAVDSDAIVPNERWNGVLDDVGLGQRVWRDWELVLVRAIARRLLGDEVPGLVSPEKISIGDANGTALANVLAKGDPAGILGAELIERLCKAPLFRCLGSNALVSIHQLADANPHGIFYVGTDVEAVDDFAPVIATEQLAMLIGKLARRPVHDGHPEHKRRQRRAVHRRRLAAHLQRSEQPLELASDMPTVPFKGKKVAGILGIAPGMPEVRIRVEGRPFLSEQVSIGYPLVAVVDLALSECSETLDGISNLVREEIMDDLRAAIPALVTAIANTRPDLFGQPTAARTLLARVLEAGQGHSDLRALLRKVPAFASVQRQWTSIDNARDGSSLRVASFADEWLPPGDGETPATVDQPILWVSRPPDDLNRILALLHTGAVVDVTSDVNRLQARRRMARGLLPTPKLPDIPPSRKRPLHALGDLGRKLGHGELGLALTDTSVLLIHEQGQLQRTMEIDVLPAVHAAIEAQHDVVDFGQMRNIVQELAVELVRAVVPELGELPVPLCQSLARAVLARRVPAVLVGSRPLFQRLDTGWLPWAELQDQLAKHGNVWAVTAIPEHREPLDPTRIVIQLSAGDIELATRSGYQIINAKLELELDAKARENRARPRAVMLELPELDGILAEVELDGDGHRAPRGKVAVLAPARAAQRGLWPYRDMQPLDRVDDPCRWPTVAVVDDARIEPDRTWSAPTADETWQTIEKAVKAASEEALARVGMPPGDALADIRITNHVCADVRGLREAPRSLIRGVLWLTAVPYAPATVVVRHAGGVRSFTPAHGLAMAGSLAVHTEDGENLDLDGTLEQLCGICHGKLVRALGKNPEADRDVAAAHVAHALALGTVKQAEIGGIKFDCFAPKPLEARALASLFKRVDPVPYIMHRDRELQYTAFIDDGSELAKVVRAHLGDRLIPYKAPRAKPAPPPAPVKPPVSTKRPAAPAPESKPKPEPKPQVAPRPERLPAKKAPHPLQPLVDALAERVARTGIQTMTWDIVGTDEPLIAYRDSRLTVAGDNPRLRTIAGELAAGSILSDTAIDAVAAHAISVLNLARTDITDATEMHALGVLLASRAR